MAKEMSAKSESIITLVMSVFQLIGLQSDASFGNEASMRKASIPMPCNDVMTKGMSNNIRIIHDLSLVMRKLVFGVSNTNRAVQSQEKSRGLKFKI